MDLSQDPEGLTEIHIKIHINQIRPMDAINCMMKSITWLIKCNPSSPDWITPGVFFGLVHFLVIESVYCCLLLVTCGYADVHTICKLPGGRDSTFLNIALYL